mgnify:CR=1 FL=1
MQKQVKGIVLMGLGSSIIPISDGFAKVLSESHSALLVSSGRYFAATALLVPFALARFGRSALPPTHRLMPHVLRTLFMVGSMTFYFMAIVTIDLATAVSAFFVGPIVGSLMAVIVLGERLTAPKVTALALGFAGAVIIARPGTAMSPGILLALLAGVCFGFYLVSTRAASGEATALQALVFQNIFGSLILLPQAIVTWQTPSFNELLMFLAMGGIAMLCHALSIKAFSHADATTLAPLSYMELITSAAVGYFWFGQQPEHVVWIGAALVASGGLVLIFTRNRSRARS